MMKIINDMIDLETISRSSPLWQTDYQYGEPNGSQCHTYGLNFYLPLHGTGNFTISPYHFQSNMSTSMVINWDINSKEHSQSELQKYFQEFKRLRPFYYGGHRAQILDSKIGLKKGSHPIKVDCFQQGLARSLILKWKGPGVEEQQISKNVLFH